MPNMPQDDWSDFAKEAGPDTQQPDMVSAAKADRHGWPEVGSIWCHTNGGRYTVRAMANTEPGKEDKFPLTVVYKNLATGLTYARRMSDWPGRMTPFLPAPPEPGNE